MSKRLRSTLLEPRVQDGVLATVLAATGLVEVATSDDLGSRPVAVAAVLFSTLPVAVRRRAPLESLAVAAAAFAAQGVAGASLTQAFAPVVGLLILVYSTANRLSGVRSALGVPVAVAGLWTAIYAESRRDLVDHYPSEYLATALFATAVWMFGYAMRGRARRIAGLEVETVRLAHEREERARAAVAAERARIARDLHDVVAHNVSVMVVQAAAAEHVLARDPERARAPLLAIQETGNQALTEMRRLLGILRADEAASTGRQPGLAGIEALAAEFREAGLPVRLSVEGDRATVPAGVDLAAYRIVEEALTNALKHAGGAPTSVSVRHVDGAVELEITDEGPGPSAGSGGHGLIGMEERAALYGGTFAAGPREGGGFSVWARLPLASDVVTAGPGR
jgi:signal transduction histidine kinase